MAYIVTWAAKAICRLAPRVVHIVRRVLDDPECVAAIQYLFRAAVLAAI